MISIRAAISEAATRIAPFIRKTPGMDVILSGIDPPVGLKLELVKHTGR